MLFHYSFHLPPNRRFPLCHRVFVRSGCWLFALSPRRSPPSSSSLIRSTPTRTSLTNKIPTDASRQESLRLLPKHLNFLIHSRPTCSPDTHEMSRCCITAVQTLTYIKVLNVSPALMGEFKRIILLRTKETWLNSLSCGLEMVLHIKTNDATVTEARHQQETSG